MRMRRALLIALSVAPLAAGAAFAQGAAPDPFGPAPRQQPANDPFGPAPAPAQARTADPFGAPPPQAGPADPFARPGAPQVGIGTFAPPPQAQQQPPPCLARFMKLRDEAQKKGEYTQKLYKSKPSAKDACHALSSLATATSKMLKYAVDNKSSCGIPDDVIKNIKNENGHIHEARTKVCQIAAAPPRPAGPSLSDALGAPIPSSSNIRPGRGGTFDTLTGSPLGK